jgi:two-component system, OmpR family, phosphate regulon sensor histidine kinase PhoR
VKLNKTRVVFGIVTVYIIAAFGWWTYAHIRASKILYVAEQQHLELLCYKATLDINGAISEGIVEDSVRAKEYLAANFPELEIVFDENMIPLENFLIRPKIQAYSELKAQHKRTMRMYALEGVVMMGLLFWGIIWIYRNLNNRLKLRRQQSNFLLSITHELKTPLASIKLYLETLQKRSLDKDQAATIVANSLEDVSRLRDLVDNVLLAAQLDNSKYELHKFEINLTDTVEKAVSRFVVPRNMQSRINLNLEKEVFFTTDATAVEMVVNNLLSNAVKYSPEAGMIDIVLRTTSTNIVLAVSDEGQGIADEDKESIFTQFYRSGDEQTRKSKGTGLGLYIVKNLLNLMGGDVKVKDNRQKGTTFELIFKKDA